MEENVLLHCLSNVLLEILAELALVLIQFPVGLAQLPPTSRGRIELLIMLLFNEK